jgi:hypothetical protein
MHTTISHALKYSLAIVAIAALQGGCADGAPTAPDRQPALRATGAALQAPDANKTLATLRRATARYHNLDAAIADGFVLLHECENRPGEGPVGTVYFQPSRLLDGRIDPTLPDALIYEPARNGRLKLVGVEFAILNTGQAPPQFLGATFQSEDEFGVYALHVWVWRHNPEGMFAETNPRVSCGAD